MGLVENAYVSLNTLRAEVVPSAVTTYDTKMERIIRDVSRLIDRHCRRRFYVTTETRYYTGSSSGLVTIDDCLAVTAIVTDEDGDRTYETTWATTDYDLAPDNAPLSSPPEPYWELRVTPDGTQSFPLGVARGVKITGRWGYYQVLSRASATVAEAVDASETIIDVSASSEFSIGHTLLIDSEQMAVSAVDTTATPKTVTVKRGVNGTTAATHDSGAAIDVFTYPDIESAAILQAQRLLKRSEAVFGVTGSAELGTSFVIARLDPDVRQLLGSYVLPGVA